MGKRFQNLLKNESAIKKKYILFITTILNIALSFKKVQYKYNFF